MGKLITDWYAFDWLDVHQVGSEEGVTAYCIGFVLLAPLSELPWNLCPIYLLTEVVYTMMQGFVAIREGITRSLSESRATAAAQEALEES
jgi:hypothetical protein